MERYPVFNKQGKAWKIVAACNHWKKAMLERKVNEEARVIWTILIGLFSMLNWVPSLCSCQPQSIRSSLCITLFSFSLDIDFIFLFPIFFLAVFHLDLYSFLFSSFRWAKILNQQKEEKGKESANTKKRRNKRRLVSSQHIWIAHWSCF